MKKGFLALIIGTTCTTNLFCSIIPLLDFKNDVKKVWNAISSKIKNRIAKNKDNGTSTAVNEDAMIQQWLTANKLNYAKTPSGLYYTINKYGSGPQPEAGWLAFVSYTSWFFDAKAPDGHGKPFDSNIPLSFSVDKGEVIKGWDETVLSMKSGEKRTVIIPSTLAYGANGSGNAIPPYSTLVFDIELVGVSPITT